MRTRDALRTALVVASILGLAASAYGQGAPSDLPPGHPSVGDGVVPAGPIPGGDTDDPDGDEALPPGHPGVAAGHGQAAGGGAPGMFEPPPDTENELASIPAGTIVVELRDPDNKLLPETQLTLGVLHQSVARGESREHKIGVTDAKGEARFSGLETGSGIAYRVTVTQDGATFGAMPFQLSPQKGMHVVLHVYPVTHDIQQALIVCQGILYAEVKDDRIQIEEVFTVFSLGKVAWVADDTLIKLPEGFTALTSQKEMNDTGVDPVDKVGGRLHGTFAPGRQEVHMRWQVPYSGEKDVELNVGLPPHVAVQRVMAAASPGMKLSVTGFPDAESHTDNQGQHILVTEKQAKREELFSSLHIKLEGLPTPGPGRLIATGVSALGVAFGLALAFSPRERKGRGPSGKARRARLLEELALLEQARKSGEVGPKTYERSRREIIDEIARTLDPGSSGADA